MVYYKKKLLNKFDLTKVLGITDSMKLDLSGLKYAYIPCVSLEKAKSRPITDEITTELRIREQLTSV